MNNCPPLRQLTNGLFLLVVTIFSGNAIANREDDLSDLSPEERAFLEDDSFFQALEVQDSPIKWVAPSKTRNQYALKNQITITPKSLKTGYVEFTQCHSDLDAISAIDIVYNPNTTQALKVLSSSKIGRVTPKAASIELRAVEKGAQVCVSGRTQTLNFDQTTQQWHLERGPYMRKFLDGYYPMHVQEKVSWPKANIDWISTTILDETQQKFVSIFGEHNPQSQPNGKVHVYPKMNWLTENTAMNIDYWFEGQLKIRYHFSNKK